MEILYQGLSDTHPQRELKHLWCAGKRGARGAERVVRYGGQ
jgi:hypothetical protein